MQENEHINQSPGYWSILTASVRYSDKLTDFEKVLFSDISALSNKNGYCNASNAYFSRVFKKTIRSIRMSIKHLIENKFLNSEFIYDKQTKEIIERRLFIACHSMAMGMEKNFLGWGKKFPGGREKNFLGGREKNFLGGGEKNFLDNNININNINMNKREGETSSPFARTIERFKKPLIEDIHDYMEKFAQQKNKNINTKEECEMFYNYYEANGWRVGKNKMKDWQAAVRTWVIRSTSDYKKGNDCFISSYL